jgi:hypothetical protein
MFRQVLAHEIDAELLVIEKTMEIGKGYSQGLACSRTAFSSKLRKVCPVILKYT